MFQDFPDDDALNFNVVEPTQVHIESTEILSNIDPVLPARTKEQPAKPINQTILEISSERFTCAESDGNMLPTVDDDTWNYIREASLSDANTDSELIQMRLNAPIPELVVNLVATAPADPEEQQLAKATAITYYNKSPIPLDVPRAD